MSGMTLDEVKQLEHEDPTVPVGFRPFFDRSVPVDIRSDISTDFEHQAISGLFCFEKCILVFSCNKTFAGDFHYRGNSCAGLRIARPASARFLTGYAATAEGRDG
jgi:hypothetical protein